MMARERREHSIEHEEQEKLAQETLEEERTAQEVERERVAQQLEEREWMMQEAERSYSMQCEQCRADLRYGSLQLSDANTVLEQIGVKTDCSVSEWTLTTHLGDEPPSFLRLRFATIGVKSFRNPGACMNMTFEFRESDPRLFGILRSTSIDTLSLGSFEVVGSDTVVPYWFTREARSSDPMVARRCICNIPLPYRDKFVDMVAHVGELRRLVLFG